MREASDNIEEYKDWMTTGVNELEKVYKFSQDGFFANEVGDLCARATALENSNCDYYHSPFNPYGAIPTTRVPYYHTHLHCM